MKLAFTSRLGSGIADAFGATVTSRLAACRVGEAAAAPAVVRLVTHGHMKQRHHIRLPPAMWLALAALAVLGLVRLTAPPTSGSTGGSNATHAKLQQPAAVLHGFLHSCPLPGYCFQRTADANSSHIEELQPQEPLMAAYKTALQQYLATKAFEERRAFLAGLPDERGIVFVGGGRGMLGAITATLWTLRKKLNCLLPVEVAYIGLKNEMDPAAIAALNATLGPVFGLDLSAAPYPAHHNPAGKDLLLKPGHKIEKKPWEAKAWALYNCRFRQVLMADYDAYPLISPEELFNGPHMTLHGNLHWGDIAYGRWGNKDVQSAMKALGISHSTLHLLAGMQPLPGMAESGHVLVDRVMHADVLEYLWWITTHSEVIYNILWGDKDTYMLAFAAAGKASQYAQMPIPPAATLRKGNGDMYHLQAMVQHDHFGRQAWVHNTQNKHWQWAVRPPAPYAVVTGPMPEWVGARLSSHPDIFTLNATRLVLLQHPHPSAAAAPDHCPVAAWRQFVRLQALGIVLLSQPEFVTLCQGEIQTPQPRNASLNLSNSNSHSTAHASTALRRLQVGRRLQNPSDACLDAPPAVGHVDQLLHLQADQQQLAVVQWASVLAGGAAAGEVSLAMSATQSTPTGVAAWEVQGLLQWLASATAAANAPSMLMYLNWNLMQKKSAPAACTSAGAGRVANADGAMPVLQLQQPQVSANDSGARAPTGASRLWSALDVAQVVWLPEAVEWMRREQVVKQHIS
ncbi:mannosyltransferase putative-domain-containing protein [Scenedesmus sp. NREL 46B-D3]|nr:mannosyltransferase putative-domain-containing protein [Scenedesmus sp. NREL 46B-D3]